MQVDISDILKSIPLIIGSLTALITLINAIIKFIREHKIDWKNLIICIISAAFLLLYTKYKFECRNPEIYISYPIDNSAVNAAIQITGNVNCLSSNNKVAILIHQMPKNDIQDRWFIHPDCASLNNKNHWRLQVGIGTQNTSNYKYEIYAFVVNDSICGVIQRITNDPTYQGTPAKPALINGIYDRITIIQR